MDSYVECLVKQKRKFWGQLLRVLLIIWMVIFIFLMMFFPVMFILAIAAGVGVYFVGLYTNVEYEYQYLDREITIDRVMNKSRRKRVGTYSLSSILIMAPINSYHLDNFKHFNAKGKIKDYSIGEELQPDKRYVMYVEGGDKLLLSPSDELVAAMRNMAPRTVFKD